ncbi:MAG TPA: pseudouridine synthase [Gemmataceae bacterium]|jgi:23S rRNA pseudouridine2605 synthase|nr:pseudouridine synthase [Gemmataceae bacterium]
MAHFPGQRVQLHRAISKLGWGSRTQARDWIRSGQVRVDGRVVTEPLTWIDLADQRISRDGQEPIPVPRCTIALNKPKGIITTRSDERQRKTVYDLLPADIAWLFPAGRLDADSEGLLILTNDSDLAVRLTEPAHHIRKAYHVTIRGTPTSEIIRKLRDGIVLSDGPTRPARVRILHGDEKNSVVEMILSEGRNRQIRRMWSTFGHKVYTLVRVAIGNYQLGDLPAGSFRTLDPMDIAKLLGKPKVALSYRSVSPSADGNIPGKTR